MLSVALLLYCLSRRRPEVTWEWVFRGSLDVQLVENARAWRMAWAHLTPSDGESVVSERAWRETVVSGQPRVLQPEEHRNRASLIL